MANYFKSLPHEELVVGFGVAQGVRTRIESVMKIRGETGRVEMPWDRSAEIHNFLDKDERHTAILVHNHPDRHPVLWLLGLVLGNDPLPSLEDREIGVDMLFRRVKSRIEGFAFGRVQLYLVQNDAIAKFSGFTPALLLDVVRTIYSVC